MRSKMKKLFPFNAEQTINIASEFGPLVTMFVVNAIAGINAGTWALLITTAIAIAIMFYMFHRPPIFPLIASTVHHRVRRHDPDHRQPDVGADQGDDLQRAVRALSDRRPAMKHNFFKFVFDKTFHYTDEGWNKFTWSFALSSF